MNTAAGADNSPAARPSEVGSVLRCEESLTQLRYARVPVGRGRVAGVIEPIRKVASFDAIADSIRAKLYLRPLGHYFSRGPLPVGGGVFALPGGVESYLWSPIRTVSVRVRDFGEGRLQVDAFLPQLPARDGSLKSLGDSDYERQRTEWRAKQKVIERCVAFRTDHLLTLTKAARGGSRDAFVVMFNEFVRRMQLAVPGWKFVAAFEPQKDGTPHAHVGVHGWQPLELVRSIWGRVIGEDCFHGRQVHCKRYESNKWSRKSVRKWGRVRHQMVQGVPSAASVGHYIAKYLGKDFQDGERPFYGHHYKTSRGAFIERRRFDGEVWPSYHLSWDLGQLAEDRFNVSLKYTWCVANGSRGGGSSC